MCSRVSKWIPVLAPVVFFLASSTLLIADKPRMIGVSRIDELPPLPLGVKANLEAQPLGIPVPILEVISQEEIARGGTRNTGTATAVVYRNSHDTGYTYYGKADAGNFIGNLLHLGNGFPVDGGEVKGYDLLMYNSYTTPETYPTSAAAIVSLWDGDPLGVIDTRISDPPQTIPGSTCTFEMPTMGGYGGNGCVLDTNGDEIPDACDGGFMDGEPCVDDTDCGLCPAIQGDDIPECPGLYRLVCNFDPKVTIPSRNVWMIVEYTGGCRVGWRWAFYEGPEIAAIGENNFCIGSCSDYGGPCVDLAIEMVDRASQWSSQGVGTCCENPGIVCNHSDYDGTNPETFECGQGATCSDGLADEFSGWCFGAPAYFASFVASIYANTDTRFMLVPIGASGEHSIVDNEIIMPDGGQTIHLEVFVADWDPDLDGWPKIKTWQAKIDSSTYTSGLGGELTNSRPPCTVHADCPNNDEGEVCSAATFCKGVWMDCPARSVLCLDLPACNVDHPDPCCGSTIVNLPATDPGIPAYAMSLRLESSPDARGTFEVGFVPDPGTYLKNQNSARVPLVAYVPAKITIAPEGQCCDLTMDHFMCIADSVTPTECYALGGDTFDPNRTCADPCPAGEDDGDACTWDACDPWRGLDLYVEKFDVQTECCHPATGETCLWEDDNPCTDDYCEWIDNRGDCLHVPVEVGTPCDDGLPCLTVDDQCIGGECIGTDIHTIPCTAHDDCASLTGGVASCNQETGFCRCAPPNCEPPMAAAVGPRYMAVTPVDGSYNVALRVSGSPDDPDVSCVVGYARADGRVIEPQPGEQPEDLAVYRLPGAAGWDTVYVFGEGLVGSPSHVDVNTYVVQTDCDPANPGTMLSDAVSVTLWRYGDVGGPIGPDGTIDFVDITMIVDGFRNVWGTPVCCTVDADCSVFGPLSICNTAWEGCQTPIVTPGRCQSSCVNLDLKSGFGCTPDCVIDFVDITAAVDVFRNLPDPCTIVCP